MFLADHEFEDAAGDMEDASGPATPKHFELSAWPDPHREQAATQEGLGRETFDAETDTFRSRAERHLQSVERCDPTPVR